MPELPEVTIIGEILDKEISNLILKKIILSKESKFFKKGGLVGDTYLEDKIAYEDEIIYNVNWKVRKVCTQGKKIFIKLRKTSKKGEITDILLFSFLAFKGAWQFKEDFPHKRVTLEFENGKKLYYNESMNWGNFQVLSGKKEILHCLKDTGMDYFSEDMNYSIFKETISQSKISHHTIHWFFEQQKFFSGIGNYLSVEILYKSKIHPERKLEDLSKKDKKRIYKNIISITSDSYFKGGFSFMDYINPYGEKGLFKAEIYGKKNGEDSKGNKITFDKIDKRGFYWCEDVQI